MRFRFALGVAAGGLSLIAIAASPSMGQVASALIHEGDPLPGAPPAHLVDELDNTAVNHAGGWALTLRSTDGVTELDHAWGSVLGNAATVLFTEGTFGDYEQTTWESFFGVSDSGDVSYSPSANNLVSGSTGLDGVWVDEVPIAVEEQVYPHDPSYYWSFGSRPGVTADGVPYWVGGITATLGGSTVNRGLFYGFDATPLILGGEMIGGLPNPLDTDATISFDYRFSALGTHWIGEVQTTAADAANNHMAIDANVIMLDGLPVSENGAIPASAGGLPGEVWDNFDFAGVTESGSYMFTGDTGGPTATDEFVLVDGVIVHREGDTLDGYVLAGSIDGAYMNEDGDYCFNWDIDDPAGDLEVLYFRDRLVLKEGDFVDWDGDQLPDSNWTISDFVGISTLTMSNRDDVGVVRLYFTAEATSVDPPATVEAAFVLAIEAVPSAVETLPGSGLTRLALSVAPNPSPDGVTTLTLRIPDRGGELDMLVTDIAGRRVRHFGRAVLPGGLHQMAWDGRDDRGRRVAAGVYLVRSALGGETAVRTVTVLR